MLKKITIQMSKISIEKKGIGEEISFTITLYPKTFNHI